VHILLLVIYVKSMHAMLNQCKSQEAIFCVHPLNESWSVQQYITSLKEDTNTLTE